MCQKVLQKNPKIYRFTCSFYYFVCVKKCYEKRHLKCPRSPLSFSFLYVSKTTLKKKRYLKCTCSLVPFFNFVCVEKCFDKPIPKIHTFTCFFFNFLCVIKCFKNWYLKYRHSLVHFSILYIKRVLRKPVSELFMFASSILYLFISLVCSFIFFQNNVFTTVLEATTLPCTSVVYTDNVESRLKTLCLYNYICEDTRLFSS